jgi:hypothetical protein
MGYNQLVVTIMECVSMPSEQEPRRPESVRTESLPPDLLEWARQTFNEEEFMADVREIRETGGLRFEDFIGEIEQRITGRE